MAILKVANIHFDAAGTTRLQANGANVLTIVTGNTEDARFDASGNLLISRIDSTVGQSVKLDVNGAINASAVLVNGASVLTTSNSYTQTVGTAGNNYTITVGAAANGWANTISATMSTASNTYAETIGAAANGWANSISATRSTASNTYAQAVGTAGNAYAQAVGTAGNSYTNAVGTAGNNYTITVAAAANGWANTISATRSTASNAYAETIGAASNTIAIAAFTKANATTYTSNLVISVADNTNAALRITQTGTGEAIRVEDETNPDTSAFIVTATGNVAVGIQAPTAKLHVVNGIAGYSPLIVSGIGGGGTLIDFQASGANYYDANTHVFRAPGSLSRQMTLTSSGITLDGTLTVNSASQYKTVEFDHSDVRKSYIAYDNTNNIFNFDAEAAGAILTLSTQNSEKVRLQPSGNLLIGRTDSTVGLGVKLDVNGSINCSNIFVNGNVVSGSGGSVTVTTDSVNATRYIVFDDATSGTLSLANVSTSLTFNPSTGTLSSTLFNSTSDINKKTNITQITDAGTLVNLLNGVRFDWKNNGLPSLGVIAQDVEKVLPELVSDEKSVNYNGLIAVLIEAVKDLSKKVEELENR